MGTCVTRFRGARKPRSLRVSLAIAAALLAVAVPGAGAATTQIGAVSEIAAGLAPEPSTDPGESPLYLVQVGESSGTYAVPAGHGVITAWRHSAGTKPGNVTFKVYRPTGMPGEFQVLAADTQPVSPGTVHTFAVRIPVRPGDRIGISSGTVPVGYLCAGQLEGGACNDPAAAADRAGAFNPSQPDPQVGTRSTLDGPPFSGLRIDVAARVETDADRDGFGDDSQDRCPASAAATQPPCPQPAAPPLPRAPVAPFADCPASAALVIRGTNASDALTGTVSGDRIFAGTGDDRVNGVAGDDCIDLGAGADQGQGGLGADLLVGGIGDDRLTGQDGADRLLGGPNTDMLSGGAGADRLVGDSGNDRLSGESGNDRMHGTGGHDRLSGSRGRDRMNGGSGRDSISGGSSADRIAGDQGNDRVAGSSGNDSIAGNSGGDRLVGGSGGDRISGGSGDDRISARDGRRDRISCGRGRDRVAADRIDRVARDCERVR